LRKISAFAKISSYANKYQVLQKKYQILQNIIFFLNVKFCKKYQNFHNRRMKVPNAGGRWLSSQGPGTEVTSPEVYESIDSEQYVFLAFKEDGMSSLHTKLQMNCLL
jgi:hypothetical protein